MITDDERRRVAAELREAEVYTLAGRREDGLVVEWSVALMSDLARAAGVGADGGIDVFARLADLIDPDCDEGRYEGVRTARPVDREALLALAEDVDGAADDSGGFEPLAGMLRDIARRIREALGVVA